MFEHYGSKLKDIDIKSLSEKCCDRM